MTGNKDNINDATDVNEKKTLTLQKKNDSRTVIERDQVHQRFARGRSKTVEVEVRRKRSGSPGEKSRNDHINASARGLTGNEFDVRMKALRDSMQRQKEDDALREQKEAIRLREQAEAAFKKQEQDENEIHATPASSEQNDRHDAIASGVTGKASDVSHHDAASTKNDGPAVKSDASPYKASGASTDYQKKTDYQPRTLNTSHPYKSNAPRSYDAAPGAGERPAGPTTYSKYPKPVGDANKKPFTPRTPGDSKKPFSKEDIKPIVLRANGYGQRPPAPTIPQDPIIIDPILDKNRAEHRTAAPKTRRKSDDEEDLAVANAAKLDPKKAVLRSKTTTTTEAPRKLNRNFISRVLDGDTDVKGRSLASMRRARQKHKQQHTNTAEQVKILRDVIIPETITVGELANRMAVRGAEVVKSLMNLGMMVTINQVIDADTAELICAEFGHTAKRVADSDIEIGLGGTEIDNVDDLVTRAPVVTVMGHVDHGKTSLLDALRETDIVSGEAGGITQHIGAYQVTMQSGKKITFIDTPGHAAFSEMRARGANATDIVILVVAADDGIMAQTIEAINHAKAANVPMVIAINKMDKPDANSMRVRQELLQHGVLLEEFGGDVMAVEVSAKKRMNLEKLEEIILLQAEVLELKANPKRSAHGVIIEAEIDKGRGTVATVLVQRGTLNIGDVFVAGAQWGRVKALVNDHSQKIQNALPSMPVEVLGFNNVPSAGDEFFVVESEQKAREITEYRQDRQREKQTIVKTKGGMENIMSRIVSGDSRELALVIKADVQGSLEAICSSVAKLGTDEVTTRVLHGAVGGINESDITLAKASGGLIVGFNVRANPQARELARRDGVEIRYYSIIYDVIDEIKALMGGLLAPTLKEKYLGTVEIRNVFTISRVDGKVAGSYVTDGIVKRGAKVRILRDSIVVHEGDLKSLKRFKDEVKEVKESYECGIVFENFEDIKVGDIVECYEIESIARSL